MAQMSRGEVQDLVSKFATESPKFRKALIDDPKALIERQLNTSLGSVNVKAVTDTADTVHVVVPYVPGSGELSDADLEKVAGGKIGDSTTAGHHNIQAHCQVSAGLGGASNNTVTNVEL